MIGIYKITNPNGKIYIGQSITIEKRMRYYSFGRCKTQTRLYNSIKKYGWASHTFEVLQECAQDQLNELEKMYGELYDCVNSGLNLRHCGGNRTPMSDETKKKMSIAHIGKKPTPEAIQKQRIALTGIKKTLTQEQRRAMGERAKRANTGRIKSPSEIEKIRASKIGKPRPDWVRKKVSDGRKDKKPILAIKDCAVMELPSLCTASKQLNRDRKTINQALKKGFYCNGYKLYYL